MHSFNDKLWILPKRPESITWFTRYCLDYPLDERNVLLVNGLSGAIDLVSVDEHRLLTECPATFALQHSETAGVLAERGYLFKDEAEEAKLRAELAEAIEARLPEKEAIFMLCPTDYCPMGCSYCFAKGRPGKAERRAMSDGQIEAAFETIDRLRTRFDRNVGTVVLYGGEPFQDFTAMALARIFDLAKRRGLKIAAFSNGLALRRFRDLLAEHVANICMVSITLDGIGPRHNDLRIIDSSFERAVESIDTLIALGVPVQVKMNLNKAALAEIPSAVAFYRQRGWWDNDGVLFELSPIQYEGLAQKRDTATNIELALDFLEMLRARPELTRFDFLPLVDNKYHLLDGLGIHPFPPEKIPLYTAVPRIHNCPSYSKHMFVFAADGRFYLCNEEIGEEHACFGTYFGGGPLEIERMNGYFTRDATTLKGCDRCPHGLFCGGGCGHHAGSQDRHFCGTLKADFHEIVRRYQGHILAQANGT
jgi:uncharacterized protein